MTQTAPTYCGRCGAQIVWGVTENGKRMPVDVGTTVDGNIVYRDGKIHVMTNDEIRELEAEDPDHPRFTPHFATCKPKK
jgi:hypothetical protein